MKGRFSAFRSLRGFDLKRTLLLGGGSVGGGATGPLGRWKLGGVAGKTITMWGDSTTQIALAMWEIIDSQIKTPGGEMAGANFVNLGLNGQTLLGAAVSEVVATNPQLVVLCFGINDVRIGGVDLNAMKARIITQVNALQAALPNCDILLWTPNSLMSVDVGSTGYVVPVASAQAYTDVMWNAYDQVKGMWPNVESLDKMAIFGRTCLPSSPLMNDILHPSNEGQRAALEQLLPVIKPDPVAIDLVASAAAWVANPAKPWLVYARALEDIRYCSTVRPLYISGTDGANYIDMGSRHNAVSNLTQAEFQNSTWLWTPNGVYPFTGFEGFAPMGDGFRMYSIDGPSVPPSAVGNAVLYHKLP